MPPAALSILCAWCGRDVPYTPDQAGQRVRCECGQWHDAPNRVAPFDQPPDPTPPPEAPDTQEADTSPPTPSNEAEKPFDAPPPPAHSIEPSEAHAADPPAPTDPPAAASLGQAVKEDERLPVQAAIAPPIDPPDPPGRPEHPDQPNRSNEHDDVPVVIDRPDRPDAPPRVEPESTESPSGHAAQPPQPSARLPQAEAAPAPMPQAEPAPKPKPPVTFTYTFSEDERSALRIVRVALVIALGGAVMGLTAFVLAAWPHLAGGEPEPLTDPRVITALIVAALAMDLAAKCACLKAPPRMYALETLLGSLILTCGAIGVWVAERAFAFGWHATMLAVMAGVLAAIAFTWFLVLLGEFLGRPGAALAARGLVLLQVGLALVVAIIWGVLGLDLEDMIDRAAVAQTLTGVFSVWAIVTATAYAGVLMVMTRGVAGVVRDVSVDDESVSDNGREHTAND